MNKNEQKSLEYENVMRKRYNRDLRQDYYKTPIKTQNYENINIPDKLHMPNQLRKR
ncbi:MAG: hypothetical protein ACRCX4_11365 [Bacteroidales bacterium]